LISKKHISTVVIKNFKVPTSLFHLPTSLFHLPTPNFQLPASSSQLPTSSSNYNSSIKNYSSVVLNFTAELSCATLLHQKTRTNSMAISKINVNAIK
jgi:hypothetical protein